MENQIQENMNRNGFDLNERKQIGQMQRIGSFLKINVVSVEWLKQCLIQEKKLNEDNFKPESTTSNGTVH